MKERGIIMTGESIPLLLRDAKTQTRRVLAVQPCPYGSPGDRLYVRETWSVDALSVYPCPPAWFRADFAPGDDPALASDHDHPRGHRTMADCYACTMDGRKFRWKPSIHMPRRLSRISLDLLGVRMERLQEISKEDAIAEGVSWTDYGEHKAGWYYGRSTHSDQCLSSPASAYGNAWNRIHGGEDWNLKPGPSPWEANPWVWVLTFKRVR